VFTLDTMKPSGVGVEPSFEYSNDELVAIVPGMIPWFIPLHVNITVHSHPSDVFNATLSRFKINSFNFT
jgi:hypothetical protein